MKGNNKMHNMHNMQWASHAISFQSYERKSRDTMKGKLIYSNNIHSLKNSLWAIRSFA